MSKAMRPALLLAVVASCLSGCSTVVPQFDIPTDKGGPTVGTIVHEVECELDEIAAGKAMTQYILRSHDVNVAILLNLDVTEDGVLAPVGAYTNGVFSFAGGVGYEQAREQNFQQQLTYSLAERRRVIENIRKSRPDYQPAPCGVSPDTNLSGRLGLVEAWKLALSGFPDVDWRANGGAFGGTVAFTVKKQISATGPTWSLAHFRGPGPFLSASESNVDKLSYSFVEGPKGKNGQGAAEAAQFLQTVLTGNISTALTSIQNKN